MTNQTHFLPFAESLLSTRTPARVTSVASAEGIDPKSYDHVIVAFSGGKDSLACLLHLLEVGVSKDRIELWHHDVDGREGSRLMDWPVTRAYCRAIARAFNLPIYFSWRQGGFEREMLRDGTPTAPTMFETPDGQVHSAGGKGPAGRRRKFPQVAASLSVRWCSAYLKIDVASTAINNQVRFHGKRVLMVTGERAEESKARANYCGFETHRADARKGAKGRHVDQWRPVRSWDEAAVWRIIERWNVNPHPAYRLGWGRVSCAACIFGSSDQWASLNAINPSQVARISDYEQEFGVTIHRTETVCQRVAKGTPYKMDPAIIAAALAEEFEEAVILPAGTWTLPAGAFGESAGPI